MIASFLSLIESLFTAYGAVGVFLASIIEEVIAPIPSSFVIMGAAYSFFSDIAFSVGTFGRLIYMVIIPAALGVTVGSFFVYGLTYAFGKPFIEKFGKYLGVSWTAVEAAQAKFTAGYTDELILFGIRAVPIIPSVVVNALCGIIRLPIKPYIIYTFLGTLVRASILGLLGWQVGAVYKTWAEQIQKAEGYIASGLIVVVLIYVVIRLIKHKKYERLY
ncbi:MAG: DedA family protein [Parcubacteria bacterium C7867-005]|nr:MAG: DedA family protein [Parcubacteria bacterium C7867-005]